MVVIDLLLPGLAGVVLSVMLESSSWRWYFNHTAAPRLCRTLFVLTLISMVGVFAYAVTCGLGNCNFDLIWQQVGLALMTTFAASQLTYMLLKLRRRDEC